MQRASFGTDERSFASGVPSPARYQRPQAALPAAADTNAMHKVAGGDPRVGGPGMFARRRRSINSTYPDRNPAP